MKKGGFRAVIKLCEIRNCREGCNLTKLAAWIIVPKLNVSVKMNAG
jgi:hypothetical protein